MTTSQTAKSLAAAAMKIAEANHYMVGFAYIDGISWHDYHDAYGLLIEVEAEQSALKQLGSSTADRKLHTINLAFAVLSDACLKAHNARP